MDKAEKIYPFGYSPAAVGMMQNRSAENNAGFFLEYLSPGNTVVDIGCGPGSITVGLAAAVAPGEVVGIDIEPSQTALGRERAKSLGLENCRFETGSVYELPIPDDSVDAVYGHTILMQFSDLDPVLAEIRRVLRPGGVIGFREIDIGASFFHSENSVLKEVMFTLRRSILHNEGNPDIGRALPSLLSSAGFEILSAGVTYVCAATPEAKSGMYAAMTRLWEQSGFSVQAESLGWISTSERAAIPARLTRESNDPGSFSGTSYAEVVARKGGA